MQRSILSSAYEIRAFRPVVGRSRIVVSGNDRMGRSSAKRVPAWIVESGSFDTESCGVSVDLRLVEE
jgi:hypothetical protein